MNVHHKPYMTVDEFLVWGEKQAEGRFELVDGEVVKMAPETVRHVLVKYQVYAALQKAIEKSSLPFVTLGDGPSVRITPHTAREPDAMVVPSPIADLESLEVTDPIIVVEVLSPSSVHADTGAKLTDYFSVGSICHYLIVDPWKTVVTHHARDQGDDILTRIVKSGETLTLDPPGFSLPVADLFAEKA